MADPSMRPNESNKNIITGPNKPQLTQNGTWGFGMFGAVFPTNLNGPLGSLYRPLPNNVEYPNISNGPEYNAKTYNGPSYNQDSFRGISGFSFNNFGTDVSGSREQQVILYIEPGI
jgi:hypothetical protein